VVWCASVVTVWELEGHSVAAQKYVERMKCKPNMMGSEARRHRKVLKKWCEREIDSARLVRPQARVRMFLRMRRLREYPSFLMV